MKSTKYTDLGVHLKVSSIEKSRNFYEETLDLTPVFGYGDETFRSSLPESVPSIFNDGFPGAPERYKGVTYEPIKGFQIEIADGHIAVADEKVFHNAVDGPKVSAMLKVESLIPLISGKNIRPTFPIRHYYWGTIEAVLKDPDGFVLVLIAPYSENEFNALKALVDVEVVEAG